MRIPTVAADSGPVRVVALGASAGGLEALKAFFDAMPAESGLAFVIVTHQAPDHISMLPELLARHSRMPVELARPGARLAPNRVYVAPPGKALTVHDGEFRTKNPPEGAGVFLSIDHFFESLARDRGSLAVGIVLSGMGSDGTLGLAAIKARGGTAMVQDEASAEHTGMPRSAAAAGVADYVLPPAQMCEQLLLHVEPSVASEARSNAELSDDMLRRIFTLLLSRTGHDFGGYKVKTIRRRVERRLRSQADQRPLAYVRRLETDPLEVDLLFRELLIGVTSFFRDEKAFAALAASLRPLLARKPGGATFRIWVPGCSTGEEAYSIAMLVAELLQRAKKKLEVQIFATDLHAGAIEFARAGVYSQAATRDIGIERLEQFFTMEGNGRRLSKEIRSMVVFAVQDLIKDPPFIKLDLLSCRNLLIYLNADTQERLVPVFHYALNPEGLLLLGTSETTGSFDRLFAAVDRKWKLYERQPMAARAAPIEPVVAPLLKALLPLQVHRAPKASGTKRGQGGRLQLELERTRGTLRGTIADFETSTEELKSSNEALQSMNEELQSANEELETSSEELQSLNEELQTVNAELEMKMEELSRSHDDMQNLLNGTSIATLFLDRDLKIQRFTDRAREIISVMPSDIGRPVHDLASQLQYDSLTEDARKVLETVVPYEKEVRTNAGEWRLLRILPYRTSRHAIDGVVITFLDVDRVKRAELLAASLSFAQSIVQTVREPLAVLDTALNIVTANPAFKKLFALSDAQLDGLSLFEAGAGFFAIPGLRRSLEQVIASGVALDDLMAEQVLPGLPPRAMLLNARRLQSETAPSGHVLLALGDANGRSKG